MLLCCRRFCIPRGVSAAISCNYRKIGATPLETLIIEVLRCAMYSSTEAYRSISVHLYR